MTWSNSESRSPALAARYLPDLPLPPYAYLPGRFPHPTRDPGGHHDSDVNGSLTCPRTAGWRDNRPYLRGIDLFNHGYYWEAHEAWEQTWHACGRRGVNGDLLRGLIHLAGAGFATRRGKPSGRRRHAMLAHALFERASKCLSGDRAQSLGLSPAALQTLAERIASGDALTVFADEAPVAVVFDTSLCPD